MPARSSFCREQEPLEEQMCICVASCFSGELPRLAHLLPTRPVTQRCLIRRNWLSNIRAGRRLIFFFFFSRTYSHSHPFSDACSPPTSSNSESNAALPAAYYNLRGRARGVFLLQVCGGEDTSRRTSDGERDGDKTLLKSAIKHKIGG